MARKRRSAEEIVAKLRQVDVLMAQGRLVADAIRAIGVTEVTYYRWCNEYGGLSSVRSETARRSRRFSGRRLLRAADCTATVFSATANTRVFSDEMTLQR